MGPQGITQAVILAGGRGERLRPLTDTLPKPMVPIHGRPFLEYLLETLRENGITEIVMLLGYLPEKIQDHFGDGSGFGLKIKYSIGATDDQTGARLKKAEALLHDHFLLLYSDNYWPIQIAKVIQQYNTMNVPALMTVYNNYDGLGEYGFENNTYVATTGLVEKYEKRKITPEMNGIEIGTFVLAKKIVHDMPEGNYSFEEKIVPRLAENKMLAGHLINHRYYSITSMERLKLTEEFLRPKKVVILDRDGVINQPAPSGRWILNPSEWEFLPGAIEGMSFFQREGFEIFIATNQRGVAAGAMTEADLRALHTHMQSELLKHGISIKQVYYCPHDYNQCECRKPKPGMLLQAAKDHHFDIRKAFFIGDYKTDYEAGVAAGCKTILLSSGQTLFEVVQDILAGERTPVSAV